MKDDLINKSYLTFFALLLPLAVLAEAKAPTGKIKNVLLIMSDDLKASALAAYSNTVCKTPNIDRLAKSGIVFERAYCHARCQSAVAVLLRSQLNKRSLA